MGVRLDDPFCFKLDADRHHLAPPSPCKQTPRPAAAVTLDAVRRLFGPAALAQVQTRRPVSGLAEIGASLTWQ